MLAVRRELVVERLLELPELVTGYDTLRLSCDDITRWMASVEGDFERLRHPLAGRISAERARLVAVQAGRREPEYDGMTPRKALRAAGATALVRAEEALRAELIGLEARLDDLREKMAQLLAVYATHKPITLSKTSPRATWLNTLWSSMGKLPEATGMHRYLEVSLSHADRMYLLDGIVTHLLSKA